jgi:hypothetical protein
MAKIVHLLPDSVDMETQVKQFLELVRQGKIRKMAIIADNKDGYVETAYNGCDVGDKQYLCSHMQVDINYEIVKVNMDQLVEYVDD